MFALTSISPKHTNPGAQRIAMDSWVKHGVTPISFNCQSEVEHIAKDYPQVEFVATPRNATGVYKAPYALISAMIDHAREKGMDHAFLINSDISINDPDKLLPKYFEQAKKGLVIANRYDHKGDGVNPSVYSYGFDAFIIHRDHFGVLPQSLFAMGQTWWDYWLPYRFIKSSLPVHLVKEPIFLHHAHKVQYDQKEWWRMTDHFTWMEQYYPQGAARRNPQYITNEVYRLIRQHAR